MSTVCPLVGDTAVLSATALVGPWIASQRYRVTVTEVSADGKRARLSGDGGDFKIRRGIGGGWRVIGDATLTVGWPG